MKKVNQTLAISANNAQFNTAFPELADELGMTEEEIKDLTAFLEEGLRDPDLKRFVPESVLSGMCFPNNDPLSKADMNCD